MLGFIEIVDHKISVLRAATTEERSQLLVNEQYLLKNISEGKLSDSVIHAWMKMAHDEAIDSPYITLRTEKKKPKSTGPIGCLPFFLVIIAGNFFLSSSYVTLFMELADSDDVSNAELFRLMAEDPRYTIAIAGIAIMGIALFASMTFPFSRTLAEYLQWKHQTPYIRSAQGDILAEELYGLKNFIHDFSDLEHAQKEMLVLWDDFLIYAVLLEENENIVNEITAIRGISNIVKTNVTIDS